MEKVANALRVLAHPHRLMIVEQLMDAELTVGELAEAINRSPSATSRLIGHIVRMQEEIGTGGGGFRFLYAAFLQEAAESGSMPVLAEFSASLLDIGDEWRAFALAGARMVKGRDAFDPPAIAALLSAQADREAAFFRDLRRALA